MYERHFGFHSKPFALTPDPAFLYLSRQHAMAMTMLEYGLESQASFSLLTGDIGSGKTTLVRRLLRGLGDQVAVGLISNTHDRFSSIHGWALSALGIAPADDSEIAQYEALVDSFVREYGRGRRTLLILDEAQNLSVEVLEELRLLSNVNSETDLVLQILLVGQPELRSAYRWISICDPWIGAKHTATFAIVWPWRAGTTRCFCRKPLSSCMRAPAGFPACSISCVILRWCTRSLKAV
jgi:type II secretory pathway predicted ATPase ExeA